jgi:chromosome segregation ATPase
VSDQVAGLEEWMRAFDLDAEKARLAQEKDRLAQENARLWNELIQRNARLDEILRANTQAEQALGEHLAREAELIEALLPNIELLRDSREVLRDRLRSRRSALMTLRELSVRGGQMKGSRVEAADGWLERHFTTGDGSNGRIYYCYNGERYRVLVSFKAGQSADIRYLQTL